MLAKLTVVAAILLVSETAFAQSELPTADRKGDYSRNTSHTKWIVVDSDPNGLNCRWSPNMPDDWYSPSASWPKLNISQWPVVRRFKKNSSSRKLTANITPAGFATIRDDSGKPWLKVNIGPNDQICLVRANESFIRPVK